MQLLQTITLNRPKNVPAYLWERAYNDFLSEPHYPIEFDAGGSVFSFSNGQNPHLVFSSDVPAMFSDGPVPPPPIYDIANAGITHVRFSNLIIQIGVYADYNLFAAYVSTYSNMVASNPSCSEAFPGIWNSSGSSGVLVDSSGYPFAGVALAANGATSAAGTDCVLDKLSIVSWSVLSDCGYME